MGRCGRNVRCLSINNNGRCSITHFGDGGMLVCRTRAGRRLKTLRGLTPYEFICKCWISEPERFILNPIHQMSGLNKPR